MGRPPAIHHCTSLPLHFFGRTRELGQLDAALRGDGPSVVAMVGPGGQGKTAIAQHWLRSASPADVDGIFLWSFYRGKDSDLCLRQLLAYGEGLEAPPDVSASFCVDRMLEILRRERWALVLDGVEVVQHEQGEWFGRLVHPELGRLLEELASQPQPGVAVLTSRFPFPSLASRRHATQLPLSTLDLDSAVQLLRSLGVQGSSAELAEAAESCGLHAKAVELLGTYLRRFEAGQALHHRKLPALALADAIAEENSVLRVLSAYRGTLSQEGRDILALATSFRQPATELRLREYLVSGPVRHLLHDTWGRTYPPFAERPAGWVEAQVAELVDLRLLERVGLSLSGVEDPGGVVIDAHPLVRRGLESPWASASQSAQARAGFLRGRPNREPPASLEEAREEVELFHAYADAGLWTEADNTLVALDNPKHRFLAPAFERDLLLRFFPEGDWRRPAVWSGFGRRRSLAICFELLGQFEEAIEAYGAADAPLRGDALLALGRVQPLIDLPQAPHPWQTLWQCYRAHALALRGDSQAALALAQTAIPVDVYEWVHLFEALLRLGKLDLLDVRSLLYQPPFQSEHTWSQLARRRMRADHARLSGAQDKDLDLGREYRALLEQYDRGGLPYERALARLGYARWLLAEGATEEADSVLRAAQDLCSRYGMAGLEIDVAAIRAELDPRLHTLEAQLRASAQLWGPARR